MKLDRPWWIALTTGSICNLALFMILPAVAEKEEATPPPVITVEFSEWQPVKKTEKTPEPVKKVRPVKPRPIKPVEKKPTPKPPAPVVPVAKPKPAETPVAKPVAEPVLTESETPPEKTVSRKPSPAVSEPLEQVLPQPVPVFKLSKMVRYIHKELPVYPPEMKNLGREASFKIKVLIDAKGKVRKVYLDPEIEDEFNQAAKIAIENSSFEPAEKNGRKVPAIYIIPVKFKLR